MVGNIHYLNYYGKQSCPPLTVTSMQLIAVTIDLFYKYDTSKKLTSIRDVHFFVLPSLFVLKFLAILLFFQ